jgi:isochorismate synthase
MNTIFSKVKDFLKQELPFVLYRKPDSQTVIAIFQNNAALYFCTDFKEKGFVFAPFDQGDSIVFPLEFSEIHHVDDTKKRDAATL